MNTLDYLKEKGDKLKKGAKKAVLGGAVAASVLAGVATTAGCGPRISVDGIVKKINKEDVKIEFDENSTSQDLSSQITNKFKEEYRINLEPSIIQCSYTKIDGDIQSYPYDGYITVKSDQYDVRYKMEDVDWLKNILRMILEAGGTKDLDVNCRVEDNSYAYDFEDYDPIMEILNSNSIEESNNCWLMFRFREDDLENSNYTEIYKKICEDIINNCEPINVQENMLRLP